ncbi:MAG: hypothetical protein QXL09_00980 [Candidatus Aenigmatarchaeota archaeon]
MKKTKIIESRGISELIFPTSIFIISLTLQILFSFLFEEIDPTENIFHFFALLLFFTSLFQYRKENEENRSHYLISYWIVATIFLAKFLFKVMWYFI